jgi:tetratricopeptide (TPR) repeat protein
VKPPGVFQGWKFTLGVAALLAAALVVMVSTRQGPEEAAHSHDDPHDAGMMERIRELQERTDRNPRDDAALLEFANLLYDVRFYERAAQMYARYLEIKPENSDARVDMGTSYFQMAFSTDSARGKELTAKAEECFLEAIRRTPRHQLAHFNLGIIRLHHGDMPGANEWFGKCVAIDPGTEAARRAEQLMSEHVRNNPS